MEFTLEASGAGVGVAEDERGNMRAAAGQRDRAEEWEVIREKPTC